jgi:hypothetical protein
MATHFKNAAGFTLLVLLMQGCAMFGGSDPEPDFVTVAVVTRGESDVNLEADSTMKSAMVGGGAGALSAGVVGAGVGAAGGLATGPLGAFLVPVGAAIGAATGAAVGGTVGVIVGGLQGLPADKAERVTQILDTIGKSRDFQAELRTAVDTDLPEARRDTSDRADALAVVQLTELELEQHLSDAVSIRIRAKMALEWGSDPQSRYSKGFDYEFQTAERHVDEWLANDGEAFVGSFDEGLTTIAREMSNDVLHPGDE